MSHAENSQCTMPHIVKHRELVDLLLSMHEAITQQSLDEALFGNTASGLWWHSPIDRFTVGTAQRKAAYSELKSAADFLRFSTF